MDGLLYVFGIALFAFRFYHLMFGPPLYRGRKPPSGGTPVKRQASAATHPARSTSLSFA